MIPLHQFWRRFSWRHARKEWLQTSLLLVILALGVGTFLSIRIANRSAVEGFGLFTRSLSGPSDWILSQPGNGIPVDRLPEIRLALDPLPARIYPVLERLVLPAHPGNPDKPSRVRLIGLDLVQLLAGSGTASGSADELDIWQVLQEPRHILLSKATQTEWEVAVGNTIDLVVDGRVFPFVVKGTLPESRGDTPLPENLALADIGTLLNRFQLDSLDRVEIVLPEGPGRKTLVAEAGRRLQDSSHDRWTVGSPGQDKIDATSMTAAFRLNLTVLSLIALLVGIYLIAQTLDATVSRRRKEIATLRSLGISPREIYRFWMSEALLYGIAAGLLGLAAGYGMAWFTVDAVTTTIRALYRDTAVEAVRLTLADGALAMALGVGGSLVAAWLPARDAASTPPAQLLRMGKRIPPFALFQHPWIGVLMVVAGALALQLPSWETSPGHSVPVGGYTASLLWLVGGTLVAANSMKPLGRILRKVFPSRASLRLAASRLAAPTSRHQLALAGFLVSIGMAAAMSFMVSSFETTITRWLDQRLRAELFASSLGFQGSDHDQRVQGEILDRIEHWPGVRLVDRFRSVEVDIGSVQASIGGLRFDLIGKDQDLLWIKGPLPMDEMPPEAETFGYANENLQTRLNLELGDIFDVPTPSGPRPVWIAGLHADYARDNGLLLVDLPVLKDWFGVNDYETSAIFLEKGADPAAVQASLKEEFPGLAIRQNGQLMKTALSIFNQTFAVTYALQVIGLTVALGGLVLSLVSLLRESGRELALQRTLGMGRLEIALSTAIEGTGIALAGLLTGLLLGLSLGLVLIRVINYQSFGWTLQTAYPWAEVCFLGGSVLLLAFLISFFTGWLYLRKWSPEAL